MTTDEETPTDTAVELPTRHQYGKLVAGVTVGFIATKLAEKVYMAILDSRRQPVDTTE